MSEPVQTKSLSTGSTQKKGEIHMKIKKFIIIYGKKMKEAFYKFVYFKKDIPYMWALKLLTVLASAILLGYAIFIFSEIISVIIVLCIMILLLFGDSIADFLRKRNQQATPANLSYQQNVTVTALYHALKNRARMLGLETPVLLTELVPKYPCLNYFSGQPFFRYIALKKTDTDLDMSRIKEVLNHEISSLLAEGRIENVAPCNISSPSIRISNISNDMHYKDFLSVDICYIDSQEKLDLISVMENREEGEGSNVFQAETVEEDEDLF